MSQEIINANVRDEIKQNLKKTGLDYLYLTDMSYELDRRFGLHGSLRAHITTTESENKIKDTLSKLWNDRKCGYTTLKVMTYFSVLAVELGHFFAVPYDQLEPFSKEYIKKNDLEKAIREEYLVKSFFEKRNIWLAELSLKFGPFPEILYS